MKRYEFCAKDGSTIEVEVIGEYRTGEKDLYARIYNDEREVSNEFEAAMADEIMEWLLENGVKFESRRSAAFNHEVIDQVLIYNEATVDELLSECANWTDEQIDYKLCCVKGEEAILSSIEIKDPATGMNVTVDAESKADVDGGVLYTVAYSAKSSTEVDCRFAVIDYGDNMVCQSDWQAVAATPDTIADYTWMDCTPDELVDVAQAAELLGVSRQRVHQLIASGKLDGQKSGRTWYVTKSSVESRI